MNWIFWKLPELELKLSKFPELEVFKWLELELLNRRRSTNKVRGHGGSKLLVVLDRYSATLSIFDFSTTREKTVSPIGPCTYIRDNTVGLHKSRPAGVISPRLGCVCMVGGSWWSHATTDPASNVTFKLAAAVLRKEKYNVVHCICSSN